MRDTLTILAELFIERQRQESKWGRQNHLPEGWLAILGEEFGEVSKAICEFRLQNRFSAGPEIRYELIQVAAVAVAMIECYDRQQWWALNHTEAIKK